MGDVINGVPEDLNKTREQWQKLDAKFCAEHNSSAANFYLIRDAQQDIERLHRALAAALATSAGQVGRSE
jgi:histidinol phosphatase-like enzyme